MAASVRPHMYTLAHYEPKQFTSDVAG